MLAEDDIDPIVAETRRIYGEEIAKRVIDPAVVYDRDLIACALDPSQDTRNLGLVLHKRAQPAYSRMYYETERRMGIAKNSPNRRGKKKQRKFARAKGGISDLFSLMQSGNIGLESDDDDEDEEVEE